LQAKLHLVSELVKLRASLQKVAGTFASFRKTGGFLGFSTLLANVVKLQASLQKVAGTFTESCGDLCIFLGAFFSRVFWGAFGRAILQVYSMAILAVQVYRRAILGGFKYTGGLYLRCVLPCISE
jgi:hypothetical protein